MNFKKAEKFFNDGVEFFWNNDVQNAIKNFNKAVSLDSGIANAFSYRGFSKYLLGDTKGAFDDINKSQEINSNNPFNYFFMGIIYMEADLEKAINLFNLVIEIDPNFYIEKGGNAYSMRGRIKLSLEDFEGAINDLNKGIEINPSNAGIYVDRAMAKAMSRDLKGAIDDFSKAIEIDPNDADSRKNRLEAATILKEQYEYSKSIHVKESPELYVKLKDADSYSNRGLGKLMFFEYIVAIDDFCKAIDLDPNYASAYYLRGSAKYGLCDYQGALDDCNKAININPKHYPSYEKRGESRKKLGDKTGSNKDFIRAKEIESNDENAFDLSEITYDHMKVIESFKN